MTKRKNEENIHQQAFNKKTKIIRFELSFTIHAGKLNENVSTDAKVNCFFYSPSSFFMNVI
jgi:hypothetical protein